MHKVSRVDYDGLLGIDWKENSIVYYSKQDMKYISSFAHNIEEDYVELFH